MCKPIFTPIAHRKILCKEDGANKIRKNNFRGIVGSSIFLTNIRPGIEYVISLMVIFMSHPSIVHLKVVKRMLRYVRVAITFGMDYSY